MANLCITTACNRHCRSCFTRPVFGDRLGPAHHMSLADFRRLLGFVQRSGLDQARLLGGEPTLHPQFPALLREALDRGLRLLVFSNGYIPESALQALEAAPLGRAAVLVNLSASQPLPGLGSGRPGTVLRRLGPRVTLGVTIDTPGVELDTLLELVDTHGLDPSIRLGLAHPCTQGSNRSLHPRYYPEVGRRLARLAGRAAQAGVRLEFDCGFVPCMFPAEIGAGIGMRCSPILDVLPDGQVVACFPLAGLRRESVTALDTAETVRLRLQCQLAPYRVVGIYRACATCDERAASLCAGGCLAAAMSRLRSLPPTSAREHENTPGRESSMPESFPAGDLSREEITQGRSL